MHKTMFELLINTLEFGYQPFLYNLKLNKCYKAGKRMTQSNASTACVSKTVSLKVEVAEDLKQRTGSEIVNELKTQWKLLWNESFSDKVKAENVSLANYPIIRIEEGTVIQASRDCKALDFKEILEQYKIDNPDKFIPPDNSVGGWNKFIKTKITNNDSTIKFLKENQAVKHVTTKSSGQQLKNGGRGWLHKF
jgi:hypothetical protein